MSNTSSQFRDFAVELAHEAGEIMLEHFEIGKASETKSDHSPVTIADTAINSLVIERVKSSFPDHTVLGEEESHGDHATSEFTWVVDPIDGTRPYANGIPTSVFSLALTKDGEVDLAVVYEPHLKRLYRAQKGEGAFLNGQQLHVNNETTIEPGSEFIMDTYYKEWKFPFLEELDKQHVHHFRIGSFVYQSMLIASGQINFGVFGGATAHDVATAALMITEAGGFAVDLDGNDQRYDQPVNGLIAGAPGIKGEAIALVKKHRNK